jgi:DNA-binding transcriptional MerR regulator
VTSGTLTTRESAEILGLRPSTIRHLHGLEILPAVHATLLPRSPRRFRREDVERVRERTLQEAAA